MIHVVAPEGLADFVQVGPLHDALSGIAHLAGSDVVLAQPGEQGPHTGTAESWNPVFLEQTGSPEEGAACVASQGQAQFILGRAAIRDLLQHASSREVAITDLANQLCICYEEMDLIYSLLHTMATKVTEQGVGDALVTEAARTLNCRRVSLLVLDERMESLRVLASLGLPDAVRGTLIPLASSVAGKVLTEGPALLLEDMCCRPDLAELSRGSYETNVFAAIRVPLQAHGHPVGVLMATERNGQADFTSRDCRLLEGLSAIGAASLMSCRLQRAIREQMLSTIRALAHAVDAKDHYTHSHSDRVSQISVSVAKCMGIIDADTLGRIELAGVLHDVGKIAIPDAILSKATALTCEEYDTLIKTHVRVGADIIGEVKGLEDVANAVLHHHERYDGSGYPDGLRGNDIPLTSRVLAVADTFDAMTSDRPYRKALTYQITLEEIRKCRATQLDPDVVDAFMKAPHD